MSNQGFVYSGVLSAEKLQEFLKGLSNAVWLSWDLANINFDENLRDNGVAFNSFCEVRWQRVGDDSFRVQVFSDVSMDVAPLVNIHDEWRTEEVTIRAVQLNEPRCNPPFVHYPVANAPKARFRCRVFFLRDKAMFVSIREMMGDGVE